MITLINYANHKYEKTRQNNTKTAYNYGKVDNVIEYGPNDIDDIFRKENEKILSYERGNGLWLWKPYFINKALQNLNEGDFLIYTDSGSFFINKVNHLTNIMDRDQIDIMTFELPLLERQFTKKETFALMEYDNFDQNLIVAGYCVFRKSKKSIEFTEKWLHYAKNEMIISPDKFLPEIKDDEFFITHREDQSIISILCHKYNIIPYRDPSQLGIRPWQYSKIGRILKFKSYKNSTFPQILVGSRGANPYLYKLVEKFKSLIEPITKIGIDYRYDE